MPAKNINFYEAIGSRIRVARDVAKLTQEELAHEVNLSRAAIANIEKGRQKLLIDKLYMIAAACKVDPKTFLPEPEYASGNTSSQESKVELGTEIREQLGSDNNAKIVIDLWNEIKKTNSGESHEHIYREGKGQGAKKRALQKRPQKNGRTPRRETSGR